MLIWILKHVFPITIFNGFLDFFFVTLFVINIQLSEVWSGGWTPDPINKLGWFVNIRSMYAADSSIKYVGSVISWCSPWNEEIQSICVPSIDAINPSSWQSAIKISKSVISFIKSSTVDKNLSNHCFGLSDIYLTAMKPYSSQ